MRGVRGKRARSAPRYTVVLYRPEWPHNYEVVATYRCGASLAAAVRTAESLTAPHAVDRTAFGSRDRTWHADLIRDGRYVDTCESPVRIVPSVGDLGWTP